MSPAARHTAVRALAPIALMGLIFYLSDQPDLSTGLGFWDLVLRKLAHIAEFAALTALWFWALRPLGRVALPLAVAIAAVYAPLDELHQSFVPGRHSTPIDVGIDLVGIAIVALALRYDRRVRQAL